MDIDLDTESSQRENVITIIKDNFDYDKVINMGTFTTEGPRSTVITACRGLGVDVDISHNISNLIPTEKTGIWSVRDTLYGNSEKGRKPVKQFKELVDRYDGLEETMVNIEGIVSGRSQHASGTIVYPNTYTNYNAMMKTKKGLEVTQFDADDTEAMGGLKLDFLSISGLARVRKCMDLLLEDGLIEWQGNLRETYNKYFHPDKLDMTSKGMYDMLLNGDVFDAFQMSSPVGVSSINKIKPETFDELAAANSLMRLTTEGEQPIDKYVRYKQDLSEWYSKMSEYGLNEEEVNKMKKHLDSRYGICDTQELIMSILVDENIANASMVYANKFRKIIAGKQRHKLKQGKEDFYKMMEDNGQREKFADYIWYECFSLQFGYSFSLPHIAAYSMILMIEMNMAYHYPTQYWKTACLSINSGLEGDLEKGTDYGTVSQAVNSMSDSIELPDINKSSMEFIPTKDEKIMFGLKPIAGLGTDAIEKVINNRPYNSVSDFYDKNIESKEMPISKAIVLVKAGAFHNINNTAREAAIELTNCHVKKRDKLTTVQLPKIIKLARQQKPELNSLFNMFEFRQSIKGKTAVPMNKKIERFFMKHYANDVEYTFDENGILDIDIKSFEKMFNKESKPLKEWLKTDEAIELLAKVEKQQFWIENFSGTPESWEMETIMFYSDKHEIDYIDLLNNFNLVNFNDMEQEKVKNTYKTKKGITKTVFETENIAGTVVEKNKAKSLVYVLTKHGVVTVRVPKYKFSYYDKKIVDHDSKGNKFILDNSWFDRGTILLLSGYRRGEEFVMYKPGRDSSDIYKIIKNDTQYNLIETKPKEK